MGKKSRMQPAHIVKRRELSAFVRRAGRVPLFVAEDGSTQAMDEAISQDLEAS